MSGTTSKKHFYTTTELAEMIGVTLDALRMMRMRREGPSYVQISARTIIYPVDDVNAWFAKRKVILS